MLISTEYFILQLIKVFSKKIFKIIKNEHSFFLIYLNENFFENFCLYLKENLLVSQESLIDITVVDCIQKNFRFEIYYNLLNIKQKIRFFIVLQKQITYYNPYSNGLMSLNKIQEASFQLEREIQDMFGIFFYNHKDLRRILTDYGFNSFPLRKDYPLTGFYEIQYDEFLNVIIINELKLVQNFRSFDFINPQN